MDLKNSKISQSVLSPFIIHANEHNLTNLATSEVSITPLVCYTYMLMVYAGDVMLYLYANGM